jgi:methionyl-tRNA formyltransferase
VTVLEARLWDGALPAAAGVAAVASATGAAAATPAAAPPPAAPVTFINKQLVLTTADGALEVLTLKPDGKKEMPAAAFAAGIRELQKGNDAQRQSPSFWTCSRIHVANTQAS